MKDNRAIRGMRAARVIREQEAFADGYFTNTRDTGIAFGTVIEGDGSRYRYIQKRTIQSWIEML